MVFGSFFSRGDRETGSRGDKDAGQQGPAWPKLPDGDIAVAVGDIHGRSDLLENAIRYTVGSALKRPEKRFFFITLGDYCDRGPDTAGVIDRLLDLGEGSPADNLTPVFLKGNHDEAMLSFYEGERPLWWLRHGGIESLESYSVDYSFGRTLDDQVGSLQVAFAEKFPERHARFIRGLSLFHELGDYLFVHAGIRPGIPVREQSPKDLMWIRDGFLDFSQPHSHYVVHGHSPVRQPEILENRAAIDTRAYDSGLLTALILEGDSKSVEFFQAD